MKNTRQFLPVLAFVPAAILAVMPGSAIAAAPGGLTVIVQRWTPEEPERQSNDVALDRPGLLGNAVAASWAHQHVCNDLNAALTKPDRIASGYSLYDVQCSMAQTADVSIAAAGPDAATLTVRLTHNSLRAKSTQPFVGAWGNPCVMLSFDAVTTATLHLDSMQIDPFTRPRLTVGRPDSCDAVADVAKTVASVVSFFGGPDFVALAQSALQNGNLPVTLDQLSQGLGSIAGNLGPLRAQGMIQQNWVRHNDLFIAFSPRYEPQSLTASVSGTARIEAVNVVDQRTRPATVDTCTVYALSASVQVGPRPIQDPERLDLLGQAPTQLLGHASFALSPFERGIQRSRNSPARSAPITQCLYTDRGLPEGIPLTFTATTSAFSGLGLRPDGWNGTLAANGAVTGKNFVGNITYARAFQRNATRPAILSTGTSSLNPQPLPPGPPDPGITHGVHAIVGPRHAQDVR